MANTRVEIYVSVVKGRQILMACSALLIVLGLITLGLEIAVCVMAGQNLSWTVSARQILGTIAPVFAIIAGIVTFLPSRLGSPLQSLRRNFIIAAVFNLIAAVLLIVTWFLFGGYFWNIWTEANTDKSQQLQLFYLDMGISQYYQFYPTLSHPGQIGYLQNLLYAVHVVAILKLTALLAEALLAGVAVLAVVLSIVNILSLRSSHIPLAGQETVHISRTGGKQEVYYENTRRQ